MSDSPRYYQAVFATRHGLSATDAKAIADFIVGKLTEDNDPAVVVAQVHPLAAAPINFPMVSDLDRSDNDG